MGHKQDQRVLNCRQGQPGWRMSEFCIGFSSRTGHLPQMLKLRKSVTVVNVSLLLDPAGGSQTLLLGKASCHDALSRKACAW